MHKRIDAMEWNKGKFWKMSGKNLQKCVKLTKMGLQIIENMLY